MRAPAKPADESKRLAALRALGLLDSPAEERFDRLTRVTKHALGVPIALVSLVDKDRQWFKSKQGLDATETPRDISFCGHAILGSDIFVVPDARKDERFQDNPLVINEPRIRFYAGCPLSAPDGSRIGTLCVIDTKPRQLDEAHRTVLLDLAQIAEREIAAVSMAITDELTGLANRCGFAALAQTALQQCNRIQEPACVLFFDLDRFKSINDSFGHDAGDQALRDFASLLKQVFRKSDIVGRISGDEFAVLASGTRRQAIFPAIEKLRTSLADFNARQARDYDLLFSAGLAEFDPAQPRSLSDLMKIADSSMYEHKRKAK